MEISFGPGGNGESWGRRKFPEQLPEYLSGLGLNGYEIECGRGVRLAEKTPALLPGLAKEHGDIRHAARAVFHFAFLSGGGDAPQERGVYFPVGAGGAFRWRQEDRSPQRKLLKMTREEATELAKDTLKKAQERLDSEGLSEIIICPETMGKVNQLGTLEEVLELCGVDERFLPTVDFGHLYARTHGGITCREDYAKMLDLIADKLGTERLNSMHIHFSRIEFTAGGEKRHLTFEDTQFGPEYQPAHAGDKAARHDPVR